MSIEFQNGFICGMATKGLVKSGIQYEPVVYNNEGEYDCFYIDFKRAVQPISWGMMTESLVVYTTVEKLITSVERLSSSLYKIYCNISGELNGITVVNKSKSPLTFADNKSVPAFSVHFFVRGLAENINVKYIYEMTDVPKTEISNAVESALVSVYENIGVPISESVELLPIEALTGTETVSVVLGG